MAAPSPPKVSALFQPTRTSLLQRGQYREQFLLQQSVAKTAGHFGGSARQSRRLSATAFTRSTRHVLAAGDDNLDDLLKGVADSINSPDQLPQSEKDALLLHAVLGLWLKRHEASGFRRWKESTLQRVDLPALIAAGVNAHEEARQLLLAAETRRRMLANERQRHDENDDKWMAANFSYAELDLLLAWARHTQPKTCRGVDDANLREALRYLRFTQYQDGEAIFYQGDKGDVFYLLLDGSVGIYGGKRPPQHTEKQKRRQSVSATAKRETSGSTKDKPDMNLMGPRMFTYRSGECFGETALFTNAAERTATAIAFGATKTAVSTGSVCELGEIARSAYSRTLKRFHQHFFSQAQRVNFTQRVFLFRDWPRARVVEVAEVLELRRISFGSVLLTEGVSPLSHCFFVLSGSVNISTQVEMNSHTEDGHSTAAMKKSRRRAQFKIELHTVRVGEIVALETLLEDEDSTARVSYTALGGSADVEVYAMKRSDGRAFLDSSSSKIVHQVQSLCTSERAHREERIQVAKRALKDLEITNKKLRLELENEALELGLTDKQQHQRQKLQELGDLNKMSCHDTSLGPLDLQRPFLTHLDPVKLLVSVDESKPVATTDSRTLYREFEVDTSLGEVAVPPKMLSTLVKSFVVRDWDTLEDDYAQRLTLQLPVRCPLSPLVNRVTSSLTCRSNTKLSTQTHTARRIRPLVSISARISDEQQTRDTHMRQISMNYDAKMHWDPNRKNFTLQQRPSTHEATRKQQSRIINGLVCHDPYRQTEAETTGHQNAKLHYQLQTAQMSPPKVSDEHTCKPEEPPCVHFS